MVEARGGGGAPAGRRRWRAELLGGLLTLLAVGAVVYALLEIRSQKAKVLDGLVRFGAESLSRRTEGFFSLRFTGLKHLGYLLRTGRIRKEEEFLRAAAVFRKRFPGFLAINWVDESGVIRWVSPLESNRAALGKNLHHHPDRVIRRTFRAALEGGRPVLSPPARLYQGVLGVAAYFPLGEGPRKGFLNGVFRLSRVRSFLVGQECFQGLVFRLEDRGKVLLEGGEGPPSPEAAWRTGYPVKVLDRTWAVRVAPGEALMARIFPWTDWVFLGLGLSLALGLGWSFFLARARLQGLRGSYLALRSSENRYRLLVENMDEGICLCNDRWIILANPRMAEILGYEKEELTGRPLEEVLPGVAEKLAGGTSSFRLELHLTRKDGTALPADVSVLSFREGPARMLQVVLRDLTKRKAMEREREQVQARLLATQKLESLGLLAGGIAHDFNNLLTGIMGNASLAEIQLPRESPVRKILQEVVEASRRAASLVRELLAYAGRGRMERKALDLSAEVERIQKLLPHALRNSMALDLSLEEGLPPIEGDPAQLQQVVMNLVVNAAEAERSGGSRVRVRTGVTELKMGETSGFAGGVVPRPGTYVFLRVEDDGPGMGKDTLDRVFDPFFSTKGPGRGLGLAAVLGIVRSWGGGIRVESRPGKGTCMEVLFPCGSLPLEEEEPPPAKVPKGAGTILVVDDEPLVGNLAKEALEGFGFRVLLARSGEEGVETFRREGGEIDVVVLDMIMPGMDGKETFRALRELRPGVKAILTSGFPQGEEPAGDPEEGWAGFLMKPFTPLDLAGKIAQVLGRA